jgi:cytochrome c5
VSAANDQQFVGTTLGVLGALVALTILIIVVANLVGGDDDVIHEAEIPRIEERVQPLAMVATDESQLASADDTEEAVELSASEINEQYCSACHSNGTLGAPVIGDEADWGQRLEEKGMETLVSHAINGFNQMPARGGNPDLSDEDIEKTVAYMLEESGQ